MGRHGNKDNGRMESSTGPYSPRHAGRDADGKRRQEILNALPTYDFGKPAQWGGCSHENATMIGGLRMCTCGESWSV